MKETLFSNSVDINTDYLAYTYTDDVEKARAIFAGYLEELPLHLSELRESLDTHNIYLFRPLIEKLMPLFASVGLTDVAEKLNELSTKCITAKDLVLYDIEIQDLIKRINSSTQGIEEIKSRLTA
jgi:hypothetical protein